MLKFSLGHARRFRRFTSTVLALALVAACAPSPRPSSTQRASRDTYEVLYANAHSATPQVENTNTDLGSYGAPDKTVRSVTIDLPEGPFVAGKAILGSCTARDARGVPVHAKTHWALHPTQPEADATNALRRKRLPTNADGFSVTAHGLIARQAGQFALLCEERDDAGNMLHRSEPTLVTVLPAEPVQWRIEMPEQGPCFDQASRLPMTWDAWDAFHNRVRDLDVTLTTTPPTRVERDASGGFKLMDEGTFELTFNAASRSGKTLPPLRRTVVIDSTPPEIEIYSPARGEMVQSDDENVILRGRIVDRTHAISSFVLEGVPQPLNRGPDGKGDVQPESDKANVHEFALPYKARWGLNVIHAKVADACKNERKLLQSFVLSESFAPLRTEVRGSETVVTDMLPSAVRATMHEHLWDHNDRDSKHDLRHLVEMAIANGGLNERLPHVLASWPTSHAAPAGPQGLEARPADLSTHDDFGINVLRDGALRMRTPEVESLRLEDGGFSMRLVLQDIELPVAIDVVAGAHLPTVHATFKAERLEIQAYAHVYMSDAGPIVEVCEDCVQVGFGAQLPEMVVRRAQAPTHFWQRWSDRALEWTLQQGMRGLTSSLRARVRADMVEQIGRMLRGLKLQHALNLPKPLRGGLLVESGLDGLALERGDHGASCAIDLYSLAESPLHRERPRGMSKGPEPLTHGPIRSPKRQRHTPNLSSDAGTFALSVSDDLLNQLMWSMWASGTFNSTDLNKAKQAARADADDEGERNLLEAAQVTFYFLTPPIIMPSSEADEIRIGVGDVYAEISIDLYKLNGTPHPKDYKTLAATGFFSIAMRAKLGVDQQAHALKIIDIERKHAEVHVVESPSPIGYMSVTHWLEKMVRLTMPHHLAQAMTKQVPLPNIQIGHLAGVPNDAAWALENVSLKRPPDAQETILQGRLGPLPPIEEKVVEVGAAEQEAL